MPGLRWVIVGVFGFLWTPMYAQHIMPSPPAINATSHILLEPTTGTVLMEHNSHERLAPASLTKIMTSYVAAAEVAAGRSNLDDEVPVSVNAWRQIGSRMYVLEGTTASYEDLLRGIVIQSGNDASVAMAEYIAGSEDAFADLMNQHAMHMGLNDTLYVNSTGLPNDSHYSSAHDVAILSWRLIEEHPEHYAMYKELEFTYDGITQPNRNRMLTLDKSVDGIKTGYTEEAGYCLAVSAVRDDMRLISVVMGTETNAARIRETRKMLSYGFRTYERRELYAEKEVIEMPRVWFGVTEHVTLGVAEGVDLAIPRGRFDDLLISVNVPDVLEAPIAAGQLVGDVQVSLDGNPLANVDVIALAGVEENHVFGRIWDYVHLFFLDIAIE